jgi:hypothetical protein
VVSPSDYFGPDPTGSQTEKGNFEPILPTPSLPLKDDICIENQPCQLSLQLLNASTIFKEHSLPAQVHLDNVILTVPGSLHRLASNGVAASASTSADNTTVCALSVAYTS